MFDFLSSSEGGKQFIMRIIYFLKSFYDRIKRWVIMGVESKKKKKNDSMRHAKDKHGQNKTTYSTTMMHYTFNNLQTLTQII